MDRKQEILALIAVLRDKIFKKYEDVRYTSVNKFLEGHNEIDRLHSQVKGYIAELEELESSKPYKGENED